MWVELFKDLEVGLREIPRSKRSACLVSLSRAETKKSMIERKGEGGGEGRKESVQS